VVHLDRLVCRHHRGVQHRHRSQAMVVHLDRLVCRHHRGVQHRHRSQATSEQRVRHFQLFNIDIHQGPQTIPQRRPPMRRMPTTVATATMHLLLRLQLPRARQMVVNRRRDGDARSLGVLGERKIRESIRLTYHARCLGNRI